MKLIDLPRGYGKTKRAIRYSIENNIPILVATQQMKDSLLFKVNSNGNNLPYEPITVNELKNGYCNYKGDVVVDDFDLVLQAALGWSVNPIIGTVTSDEYKEGWVDDRMKNGSRNVNINKSTNTNNTCVESITASSLCAGTISAKPSYTIEDIEIVVPGKVVNVYFHDGTFEKMVCSEEDEFDLRKCCFIAIAKKLYRKTYTFEGIEAKAIELSYTKEYTKIVDKALKTYEKDKKRLEAVKKELQEVEASHEKQRLKKEAYKKRRAEKIRNEKIAIQKEAILQAYNEIRTVDADEEISLGDIENISDSTVEVELG